MVARNELNFVGNSEWPHPLSAFICGNGDGWLHLNIFTNVTSTLHPYLLFLDTDMARPSGILNPQPFHLKRRH